jgi:hypothetical protein
MSTMKNHVVSLEVAKRLKDYLPEELETHFVWVIFKDKKKPYLRTLEYIKYNHKLGGGISSIYKVYLAPILSEMLELLPLQIKNGKYSYSLDLNLLQYNRQARGISGNWRTASFHGNFKKRLEPLTPDKVAELYMWCIDSGYIPKGE